MRPGCQPLRRRRHGRLTATWPRAGIPGRDGIITTTAVGAGSARTDPGTSCTGSPAKGASHIPSSGSYCRAVGPATPIRQACSRRSRRSSPKTRRIPFPSSRGPLPVPSMQPCSPPVPCNFGKACSASVEHGRTFASKRCSGPTHAPQCATLGAGWRRCSPGAWGRPVPCRSSTTRRYDR